MRTNQEVKDGITDAAFIHLDQSLIRFSHRKCDLCGNNNYEPVYTVSFLNSEFSFVKCKTCRLIYQNPVLEEMSRAHLYETVDYWDYRNATRNNEGLMLNYYSYLGEKEARQKTADHRLKWIRKFIPEKSSFLDLGCSDGLFVETLQQAGFDAQGMDISSAMISVAQRNNVAKSHCFDFEKPWPFARQFDVITCFAALSNFINPSRVFANIQKFLKPGGAFLFNFGSPERFVSRLLGARLYLYRPTVATIYSRETVNAYCQKYGLKIQNIQTDVQMVPLARLLGFLRIPGIMNLSRNSGIDRLNVLMPLLTGYLVHAGKLR